MMTYALIDACCFQGLQRYFHEASVRAMQAGNRALASTCQRRAAEYHVMTTECLEREEQK